MARRAVDPRRHGARNIRHLLGYVSPSDLPQGPTCAGSHTNGEVKLECLFVGLV